MNSANLKAYYRFESGALTTDSTANSKTLTNTNTVADGTGKFGGGADMSASNTNKKLSIAENLGVAGNGNMSIVGWIKLNAEISSGLFGFFDHRSTTTANLRLQIYYDYNGGTRRMVVDNAGTTPGYILYNTTLGTTNWHHIAVTRASGTAYFYLDGAFCGSVAQSTGTADGNSFTIGSIGGSNYASAIFDDVGVFDTALSADQIKELYEGRILGELRTQTGLGALYHLENVNDSSGNSRTLTNNGTVTFSTGKFNKGAVFSTTPNFLTGADSWGCTLSTTAYTIGFWLKLNGEIGSGNCNLVFNISTDNVYTFMSYEYNGGTRRLRFERNVQGSHDDNAYLNTTLGATWHYVVMTWDTTNIRGYLDGNLGVTLASASGTAGSTTAASDIRCLTGGIIDEFFVFGTVAKSASWVRQQYAIGRFGEI